MVTEYESGKAIPNQQILAKMERALGWKLHFHFHMKPNYFWIDHAIDVHSHDIPHSQALNCEARTRASPWKPRPQVITTWILTNLHIIVEVQTCLHLIRLRYLIFSLRWQEEVGRSWAKPEDDCQKSSHLITIIKFSIFWETEAITSSCDSTVLPI